MTIENCNPKKLTEELQAAGLPVSGVASTGRVDFTRELTKSERTAVEQIINKHDPAPTVLETRIETHNKAGINLEDLILALWDQIIKGDSSAATALKSQMDSIDAAIN